MILAAAYAALFYPVGGTLSIGPLLDPIDGVWATARNARPHESGELYLETMDSPVVVQFDERGVPHIYAENDKDASIAFGYIIAQDRLFEMDFIHRLATGTLSEMMGSGALGNDLFFIRNGIRDAVLRNTALLESQLPREFETVGWYASGVNAYLNDLTIASYPFEYRILGATPPSEFTSEFTMALYAYMAYDLSFRRSDIGLEQLRQRIGAEAFSELYPRYSNWETTIVPPEHSVWTFDGNAREDIAAATPIQDSARGVFSANSSPSEPGVDLALTSPLLAEGFFEGKGSNNWAVGGSRSTTGKPILAGDMHLGLSLPAIWYEAHIVTPTVNVYGVTFPAVPSIVEGITPDLAWTFTNTGADQIDYLSVELDEERKKYLFDDEWLDLSFKTDTVFIRNADPVIETVAYTHYGPVLEREDGDFAMRWVGHEFGATFSAVWDMARSTNYEEFERAIRQWDYPMQNILYAGADDIVAIRSTGYLPIRGVGNAFGVLDGTTSDSEWIGRVAFEELPHSISPSRGYLTSTNQRPAGIGYPHYLGQDWRSIYRSMRIEELLSGQEEHSPGDIERYQSDLKAVQAGLFLPFIREITGLSDAGQRLQMALSEFDGHMDLGRTEPRLFSWFMRELKVAMWDEAIFEGTSSPKEIRILDLLNSSPESIWFDIESTPEKEVGEDIFRMAVEKAASRWEEDGFVDRKWGDVQSLQIRHLTRSTALRALWREDYPFGGYAETLSPGASNPVTASASWRVIVDFSTSPPKARGIYPGGQSGSPFSNNYDAHIQKYVDFEYYQLDLSASPK